MSKLKIGIAGLGTVGQGVFKIISEKRDLLELRTGSEIEIVAVSSRDRNKDRGLNLDGINWYENALDLADDKSVDAVVELIGGDEGVARELAEKSLQNKKHFITANKALIAKHGHNLTKLAEANKVNLLFEAAVAGGIPIIKTLKESLAGNEIKTAIGVLNGTCNFILSAMQNDGKNFAEALDEAQQLGYAEADPTFDIEGVDAAHKLTIISAILFGLQIDFSQTQIEGIKSIKLKDMKYATSLGYNIKLVGVAEKSDDGKILQAVFPAAISHENNISKVEDVLGAIWLNADALGELFLSGAGAGMMQTASSVLSDICDIAADRYSHPFGVAEENLIAGDYNNIKDHESEFFLRFTVDDKDGVLSSITSILSSYSVGFEKVHQEPIKGNLADIIILTHKASESRINNAMKKVEEGTYITEQPVVYRVL